MPTPLFERRPISAANGSASSATARCRWSRAACWPNGTARRLSVHGAAKVAFTNRRILARQMGLPESAIAMVEHDVGGGFGARGEFYPEDFLIPFAARLTGRPVKWIEDRREHLLATNHARDADCELEIACDRDGTILGLRGRAAHRSRCLYPNQRPDRRAQHRAGPHRPLSHCACAHRCRADDDQQDPVRHLSWPRPLRGRLLSRAAVRYRRGRARHRSRRVSPPQPDC